MRKLPWTDDDSKRRIGEICAELVETLEAEESEGRLFFPSPDEEHEEGWAMLAAHSTDALCSLVCHLFEALSAEEY